MGFTPTAVSWGISFNLSVITYRCVAQGVEKLPQSPGNWVDKFTDVCWPAEGETFFFNLQIVVLKSGSQKWDTMFQSHVTHFSYIITLIICTVLKIPVHYFASHYTTKYSTLSFCTQLVKCSVYNELFCCWRCDLSFQISIHVMFGFLFPPFTLYNALWENSVYQHHIQ